MYSGDHAPHRSPSEFNSRDTDRQDRHIFFNRRNLVLLQGSQTPRRYCQIVFVTTLKLDCVAGEMAYLIKGQIDDLRPDAARRAAISCRRAGSTIISRATMLNSLPMHIKTLVW